MAKKEQPKQVIIAATVITFAIMIMVLVLIAAAIIAFLRWVF